MLYPIYQYSFSCPFWAGILSDTDMIDTIKYRLSDYSSDADFREQIPCYLDKVCESKRDNQIFFSGDLGNLKVRFSKNLLSVENSLCKWYLGDNLQTLTRESIKLANEKLSDILHVNMQNADVIRLDIGYNFPMNHKPKAYFDSLGQLPRYNRLEQPNGVCYRTNNKELIFYDKIIEYRRKCGAIPVEYSSLNLLRYELKFLRDIKTTLKRSEIKVQTLSDMNFYTQLIELYSDMYFKVHKEKEINFNIGDMRGVKGLNNAGIALLMNEVGSNRLLKQIKNNHLIGAITEKEKRGMINRIGELNAKQNLFVESAIVKELDNSIRLFANPI